MVELSRKRPDEQNLLSVNDKRGVYYYIIKYDTFYQVKKDPAHVV